MWWNLVARSRAEIDDAFFSWQDDDGRFGSVKSEIPRISTTQPWWMPK